MHNILEVLRRCIVNWAKVSNVCHIVNKLTAVAASVDATPRSASEKTAQPRVTRAPINKIDSSHLKSKTPDCHAAGCFAFKVFDFIWT